jgi:hypothetical protein
MTGSRETSVTSGPRILRWLKFVIATAVIVALSIVLRGGGTHFLLAFSCLCYVVLPWYLAGWAKRLWLPFVGRGHSDIPRGIRRNPGWFVTTAIAVVISFFPGCAINRHRVDEAMRWGDGVVLAVEAYQAAHGAYPDSISAVADVAKAPALVRIGMLHYEKSNFGFDLDLWDEDSFIFPTGWRWSSQTRAWERYN